MKTKSRIVRRVVQSEREKIQHGLEVNHEDEERMDDTDFRLTKWKWLAACLCLKGSSRCGAAQTQPTAIRDDDCSHVWFSCLERVIELWVEVSV